MISFEKFVLDNGLRVIFHHDITTPMATVNVLYDVGARDEDKNQTGFAHLFEHLMFGGSENIPVYDEPLQRVGGENNAFTSNDITNYYITLPAQNIETALWLESDRMLNLAFSEKSLEVQRNVVCEEFKQRYLNQPYGDVWLKLRELAYEVHPYQWATIGKELSHIENAKIEDVKAFFKKHYNPQNAVLVVAGNLDFEQVKSLVEKWFGGIPSGEKYERNLPKEPLQHTAKKLEVKADVPLKAIYKAYKMCSRSDADYHATDLLSDVLSRGHSSRLYQALVKEQQLFSEINAYIMGSFDEGLFVVEGKLMQGVTMENAEIAIQNEISKIQSQMVSTEELTKVKNKMESTMIFSEMSLLDKAMSLAIFELLGDANDVNAEVDKYLNVTPHDMQRVAQQIFQENQCSTLYYSN